MRLFSLGLLTVLFVPLVAYAQAAKQVEVTICSEVGTLLEERNVERAWYRVRRRAQKAGCGP
jgi:hypothetical protein